MDAVEILGMIQFGLATPDAIRTQGTPALRVLEAVCLLIACEPLPRNPADRKNDR